MIDPLNQKALVGIRGYAALWIFFGHLFLYPIYNAGFGTPEHLGPLAVFVGFHFLGVDFFFLLSGLLLTLKYREYFEASRKSMEIDRFYALRLARVYPLHLFFTLLVGICVYAGIAMPISSGTEQMLYEHWRITGILNITLMNGWGILPVASWNEPAWTLSVFFLLYIIFPNLVTAMRTIPDNKTTLATALIGLLVGYGLLREYLALNSQSDGVGGILRGLFFFLTGMFCARLYTLRAAEKLPWGVLGAALLVGSIALMYIWAYVQKLPLTGFHLLYPFGLLALLYAKRGAINLFSHPIAEWVGKRSFAIYLCHYPLLILVKAFAGAWLGELATQSNLLLVACYIGVTLLTLLVSDLCYRLIEMPAYGWARKKLGRA